LTSGTVELVLMKYETRREDEVGPLAVDEEGDVEGAGEEDMARTGDRAIQAGVGVAGDRVV
jgi:hypothetical protein